MSDPTFEQLENEECLDATVTATPVGDDSLAELDRLIALKHGKDKVPQQPSFEKPWHRFALNMAARAKMSSEDIAKTLGCDKRIVQALFRQDWFKHRYEELVGRSAGTLYEVLLDGEDVNSLMTIIELRDNPKIAPNIRLACARDILDRIKGKPVQHVQTEASVINDKTGIEDMQAELAQLDKQQEELLGATQRAQKQLPGGVVK